MFLLLVLYKDAGSEGALGHQSSGHTWGLGVTEAAVELEHARAVARDHEARVEHAAERAPLRAQAVHRALQHVLAHPVQLLVAHLQFMVKRLYE